MNKKFIIVLLYDFQLILQSLKWVDCGFLDKKSTDFVVIFSIKLLRIPALISKIPLIIRLVFSLKKHGYNISFAFSMKSKKMKKYNKSGNFAIYSHNLDIEVLPRIIRDYGNVRHVFLGHGTSDKAYSFNKLIRLYDTICVSDETAFNALVRNGVVSEHEIKTDRIKVIGQPPVMCNNPNINTDVVRILYSPTHSGGVLKENLCYSSLYNACALRFFNILVSKKKIEVIFRPHPHTNIRKGLIYRANDFIRGVCDIEIVLNKFQSMRGLNAKHENVRIISETSVLDFSGYDLVVTDISSMLGGAVYAQVPAVCLINETIDRGLGDVSKIHGKYPLTKNSVIFFENEITNNDSQIDVDELILKSKLLIDATERNVVKSFDDIIWNEKI